MMPKPTIYKLHRGDSPLPREPAMPQAPLGLSADPSHLGPQKTSFHLSYGWGKVRHPLTEVNPEQRVGALRAGFLRLSDLHSLESNPKEAGIFDKVFNHLEQKVESGAEREKSHINTYMFFTQGRPVETRL